MGYLIQRKRNGNWQDAWGFKPRSRPKASTDREAIAIFRKETARCRTNQLRLVKFCGYGYNFEAIVLAGEPATCGAKLKAPKVETAPASPQR